MQVIVRPTPYARQTNLRRKFTEHFNEEAPARPSQLLVTIDPLLGELKAEHYSGKTLRSRTTYQIDVLDEATIRGRYVLPTLGPMVLELHRAIGRVTETIGGKEPTDYNCEPPSSSL